jgi:phosphotransferase system HPr (HPr) family protein
MCLEERGANGDMSEQIYSRTVTIVNPPGLHLRPAKLFVEMASQYQCRIELVKDDMRIDGKSILSILTLGAAQGTRVSLEGTGPDSHAAIDALAALIESGFPEETEIGTSPKE